MARTSRIVLAALLAFTLLPSTSPVAAQADGGSAALVPLFSDGFDSTDGDNGWTTNTRSTGDTGIDKWSRATDGDKPESPKVWYASRLSSDGKPAGYSNNADVFLVSPTIPLTPGFFPRSVGVVLRGSSEAYDGEIGDYLALQWAPSATAQDADWQTLKVWSGVDAKLEPSYQFVEASSTKLLQHRGDMVFRFRFQSDATCDSNPGDTAIEPVLPPVPIPPAAVTPGPTPNPTVDPGVDPNAPPGTVPSPTANPGPTPAPGVAPAPGFPPDPTTADVTVGEDAEIGPCGDGDPDTAGPTYQGWFLDQFVLIGRRDFTTVDPDAVRVPVGIASTGSSVDLLADKGKLVEFRVEPSQVPAGATSILVRLDRQGSTDILDLAAFRDASTGMWSALLAVDEPDLIAGTWDVQFIGQSSSGGSVFASTTLAVRAQDQAVPVLTALPTGNPVLLGPGSGLTLDVKEAFLRRVTMSFAGLPTPMQLPFPYHVPVASFPEGSSTVTFRAEDRTGHVASLDLNVVRDTIRPHLTVLGPPTVYAGVPFDLGLVVIERSAHSIHVDVNGTLVDLTAKDAEAAAGKTTTLQVTPPAIGELTITTRIVDAFGNEVVQVREFVAVQPVTDLRLVDVRLATPATNTATEGHGIVAVIEQVGGVAPLPATVTFEAGGRSQSYTVTVPATGPFEVRWDTNLPPGPQTVKVSARMPENVNETLPGNENGSMTVESFLGRVTIGSKVYNIRADARGLPTTAVLSGTSKTYPLALVQDGAGVQYQFTADGNRTVLWDPLKPVATLPAAETQTSTSGGKDAPFPGLLMAMAVLALALLMQRRK